MQMRDVEKNSYILPVSHIKKIKSWYLNPLDASFESGTYFKTTYSKLKPYLYFVSNSDFTWECFRLLVFFSFLLKFLYVFLKCRGINMLK